MIHSASTKHTKKEAKHTPLSFAPQSSKVQIGQRPSLLEMSREQYQSLLKSGLKAQLKV